MSYSFLHDLISLSNLVSCVHVNILTASLDGNLIDPDDPRLFFFLPSSDPDLLQSSGSHVGGVISVFFEKLSHHIFLASSLFMFHFDSRAFLQGCPLFTALWFSPWHIPRCGERVDLCIVLI